jgi:AAA15 family ATPase/GTPase
MVKGVSIHNFKALQRLENVRLGNITLVGGKNNAGKSSFLEALFLYLDRRNPDKFLRQLIFRGMENSLLEPEHLWKPFFYDFDLSKNIIIEVQDLSGLGKLSVRYESDFSPKTIAITNNGVMQNQTINKQQFPSLFVKHEYSGNIDLDTHSFIIDQGINHCVDKDTSQKVKPATYVSPIQILDSFNPQRLGILDKNDEQEKILQILRIFEPKLEKLQLIKVGFKDVIYAVLDDKRKIPVNFLGTGFCRSLTLALILATNEHGVLFIDEIENGIHHSFLNDFWNFLIEATKLYNCQVVATTHSYEMINSFSEVAQEKQYKDVAYIRLGKDKNGIISAYPFNYEELNFSIIKHEMEIR